MPSCRPLPHPENPERLPAFREYPSRLFVETTTRCNCECPICVKRRLHRKNVEGDLSWQTFKAIEPAFPTLEALILGGSGEPLMHQDLEAFIRRAKRLMPESGWVGLQSHAFLLETERALSLVKTGLDRICLSLDSFATDAYHRVREGGETAAVERALIRLATAKSRIGRPEMRVGVEFVLMRDNLRNLPGALHWAACRGASFALVTQLIPYDFASSVRAAYPLSCSDAAIEIFEHWKSKAAEAGADISRYFEIFWKQDKTPAERQIVHFVQEMKQDAIERRLFFDLKKLLQLDRSWLEKVAEVFEEAREIARETGLELHLPAIVPQAERCCHFIEKGGAFISWDGRVHPCFFHWHHFNSFPSDEGIPVPVKEFGTLEKHGIGEIWNDPAFRAFRERAADKATPNRPPTPLPPSIASKEGREAGDHHQAAPCDNCLWRMDLFRSLS